VQTVGWRCNPNRCSRRPNDSTITIFGHWSARAPGWPLTLRHYGYSAPKYYGYGYGPEISFAYGAGRPIYPWMTIGAAGD
jgi:hypothetical protein